MSISDEVRDKSTCTLTLSQVVYGTIPCIYIFGCNYPTEIRTLFYVIPTTEHRQCQIPCLIIWITLSVYPQTIKLLVTQSDKQKQKTKRLVRAIVDKAQNSGRLADVFYTVGWMERTSSFKGAHLVERFSDRVSECKCKRDCSPTMGPTDSGPNCLGPTSFCGPS